MSETKTPLAPVIWSHDLGAGTRRLLNTSELAQEIAAELPGWNRLAASAHHIADAKWERREVDRNMLAAKILDGADPLELAREAANAEGSQAEEIAFHDLLQIATRRLSQEVNQWLDSHQRQLTETVLGRLRNIVEETAKLPSRYAEEQRADLAQKWDALTTVHQILTGVHTLPHHLPHVDLFDDYTAVWPTAFTFEPINGAGIYELGQAEINAAHAPWRTNENVEPNTVELLRFIADNAVKLWLPSTQDELDAKQAELEQTARDATRALNEAKRLAKARA